MAKEFPFTIATAFPNGKVAPALLHDQIDADAAITVDVEGVNTDRGVCTVVFVTDLPSGEVPALNAVVAAHQGVQFADLPLSPVKIVSSVVNVVSSSFAEVGGAVINIARIVEDLPKARVRLSAAVSTTGTGSQILVTEEDAAGVVVNLRVATLPSTGGAVKVANFDSNVAPRPGTNIYRLQAKLGGSAFAIRFASFDLIYEAQSIT